MVIKELSINSNAEISSSLSPTNNKRIMYSTTSPTRDKDTRRNGLKTGHSSNVLSLSSSTSLDSCDAVSHQHQHSVGFLPIIEEEDSPLLMTSVARWESHPTVVCNQEQEDASNDASNDTYAHSSASSTKLLFERKRSRPKLPRRQKSVEKLEVG